MKSCDVEQLVKRYDELTASLNKLDIHSREFVLTLKICSELRYQINKNCVHRWEGFAPYTYKCLDCGIVKD